MNSKPMYINELIGTVPVPYRTVPATRRIGTEKRNTGTVFLRTAWAAHDLPGLFTIQAKGKGKKQKRCVCQETPRNPMTGMGGRKAKSTMRRKPPLALFFVRNAWHNTANSMSWRAK